MEMVSFATRVCKVMGIETMLVTNAAGGLNPDYRVGDIVILNDVRFAQSCSRQMYTDFQQAS